MPPAGRTADPSPARRRPVTRAVGRRRSRPPEQIPVWTELAARAAWPGTPDAASADGDALLEGLNIEQRRAVTHGEGPLLVVAGAGTGKTQVVTRRIAWLIATHRARPSEILALTFTDKAAAEMQGRVDQLVPYGYTDTAIATFHAFGDRLIREYALELGLRARRPGPVAAGGGDLPARAPLRLRARRATGRSATRPASSAPWPPTSAGSRTRTSIRPTTSRKPTARSAAAELLAELAEGDAADDAERPPRWPSRRPAASSSWRARTPATRSSSRPRGSSTSATRSRSPSVSCARSPAARDEIRRRFRYILVDEFQDTNRAQAELVELLAAPHRNVTVVGDDDQSIYRFRGAAMSNIVEFRERSGRPKVVVLRRNYRSRAGILEASHRLIRLQRPGPARGPGGDRQATSGRQRPEPPAGSAPARRPARGLRHRGGGGRLGGPRDRRADRPRRRAAATTRSSSGRTPRPTRSSAASTWPASRGGSPGPRASMRGPRSGSCSPSCAPSPTSARASTCTPSRPRRSTVSRART